MTFEEAIEGLPIIIMGGCCTIEDVIAKEERGDVYENCKINNATI